MKAISVTVDKISASSVLGWFDCLTPANTYPPSELSSSERNSMIWVGRHCEVDLIMYSLSNEQAVEDVVFGAEGILSGIKEGQIAMDMSTVLPATRLREQEAYAKRRVIFSGAGLQDPHLDQDIQPLALTETAIDDLVGFTAALTSPNYKEPGATELARQRAISQTTRPQRETVRAFAPKPPQPPPK